jgi:hypothetical protein
MFSWTKDDGFSTGLDSRAKVDTRVAEKNDSPLFLVKKGLFGTNY